MARRRLRKLGFWYYVALALFKPLLLLLFKRDWRGMENIPEEGGFVAVVNHLSYLDGPAYLHFQHDAGRPPYVLGKAEVFDIPYIGRVLRGTGRIIPVYRETVDAALAYRAALTAVQSDAALVLFPEGTFTRDPDLWPMTAKFGAARIALATQVPVVPVALWGTQEVITAYGKRLHLLPRKTFHVLAGPPVDLSAFRDRELTPEVLREATESIMDAITRLLEELRGEQAPARRFDPRAHGLPVIGEVRREAVP